MKIFLSLSLFLCAFISEARVNAPHQLVRENLKLPFHLRIKGFSSNEATFLHLKKLSQNKKESMNIRWKSLMSLSFLFPKKSLPILEQNCKSTEWFMRNACLVSLSYVSKEKTRKQALKLLFDKALVVRTEAVKALRKHGQPHEDVSVLWEALYRSQNFRGSRSLWIRKHIVDLLSDWKISKSSYMSQALQEKDLDLKSRVLNLIYQPKTF